MSKMPAKAGPSDSYIARTLTDTPSIDAQLRLVGARGFATDRPDLGLSRACVAAPIRGRRGAVLTTISISGPLSAPRLEVKEMGLARMAIEAAGRIGTTIGAVDASPASAFQS